MKIIFCFLIAINSAFAQNAQDFFKIADAKIYSLKSKGVKDFVVDVESSQLTKQMNEQQTFGKIEELTFRIYWTANPERLAMEVHGLPDGFKEVKEELKASLMSMMDILIPQSTVDRFKGYNFTKGQKPNEYIATDSTGIAAIPKYILSYDDQSRLLEIKGEKAIGTFSVKPTYMKESFSDGRWVLKEQTTTNSENGQTLVINKVLKYDQHQGMGVLGQVDVITEQHSINSKAKPVKLTETLKFKNYKTDNGEALKYFLGEGAK